MSFLTSSHLPPLLLPMGAHLVLEDALSRKHPRELVAVIDTDGFTVEGKDSFIGWLFANGCTKLARKIASMPVPDGSICVYCDLERGTSISVHPLSRLLGTDEEAVVPSSAILRR